MGQTGHIKRSRLMRVHEEFAFYADDFKKTMKGHGKEMSLVDITQLIAKRDRVFFERKKRSQDSQKDDFYDVLGL